jgi:hypothetical protein
LKAYVLVLEFPMRLFFDLRLGYLVEAPGQSAPSSGYIGKAGDGQPVELQFGRSPDPLGSSILFEAPTWTSTGLPGGTVIQLAIKASGEFSDGPVLASTSTFSYDDGTKTYSGALNLNTEQINTELERGNDDDEDDIASILCGLEVTYQSGGSGAWASSVLPVTYQINHDLIYGDEATPANAEDPDEYLLKVDGIRWLKDSSALTGGGTALDGVPTVDLDPDIVVGLYDESPVDDVIRFFRLEAGTEAESSPDIIRPDDYNASTNAKFWRRTAIGTSAINIVDDTTPQLGGTLDANAKQIRYSKGADVASAAALTLGTDGNYFDITGTTAITSIATLTVGTVVKLHFDAALTLTHHATDLILPTGANITTAAGDEAEFVEYATGDWRCVSYQRASGASLAVADIVLDTTPQLGGVLDSNGKQIRWSKGADLTSASELILGNDGNYFSVSGTTTIDTIATKGVGTVVMLRFTQTLTIVDNTILLPGVGNITTVGGDVAVFVEESVGQWRCISYTRANGPGSKNVYIPASEMKTRTTAGAAAGSTETTTHKWNFDTFDFDTTTAESVDFITVMPSNYGLGVISARVYWTASSGTGTVTWSIKAAAFADSLVLDSAAGTAITTTDTLLSTGDMHITSSFGSLTPSGTMAANQPIIFNVARDPATDTLNADAKLIGVELSFIGTSV